MLYKEFGERSHYISDSLHDYGVTLLNGFDFFSGVLPAKKGAIPEFIVRDISKSSDSVLFVVREYLGPVITFIQQRSVQNNLDTGMHLSLLHHRKETIFKVVKCFQKKRVFYRATSYSFNHKWLRDHSDVPSYEICEGTINDLVEGWQEENYFNTLVADTDLFPMQMASMAFWKSKNNYLIPLDIFKRIGSELRSEKEEYFLQGRGTFNSFAGEYVASLHDKQSQPSNEKNDFSYALEDAENAIYRRARKHKTVILNEDHMQPLHRRFAAHLLDSLYALGFKHLFVETLASEDSTINSRGFPIQESGYYTAEPAFGNFLRKALKTGFTLHAYESDSGDVEREKGEAQNVANFVNITGEKAIVYCGWGHLNETPADSFMGYFLAQYTGLDPLTIQQTTLTEQIDTAHENLMYRRINREHVFSKPQSLVAADSILKGCYTADMVIVHPRSVYSPAGRPLWQLSLADSGVHSVSISYLNNNKNRSILQIFKAEENELKPFWELIPVAQFVLGDNENISVTMPAGQYSIYVTDRFRNILDNWKM